jgi:hypothetical protein
MGQPLFTVTNRVDPHDRRQDELFEFGTDGQSRTFGRDHEASDIVIWPAHNGTSLARRAGEIWRWGDELWIRNLATGHELDISTPGNPPEQPLRRRRDHTARGAACSVPAPFAIVTAPDGCFLEIRQDQISYGDEPLNYGLPEPTVAVVPEVPDEYRRLAAALCEPLLRGGRLPAAYAEVMARLKLPSLRALRRDVEALCEHYTGASAQLARRVEQRRRRQEATLGGVPDPVRHGAIYKFDAPDAADDSRARSLALPDYYEVAILLVRHYRITADDLALLPQVSS